MRRLLWPLLGLTFASIALIAAIPADEPKLTGTLVVANQKADNAYLIRLSDGKVVRKLPTKKGPHEAAVSPSGKIAVVTNYIADTPSLLVIDVASGKEIRTIELGDFTRPHAVKFIDEDHVVSTSETTQRLCLVNIQKGEVVRGLETQGKGSHMVALTGDRKTAYTGNIPDGTISKIDVATGKVLGQAKVGKGPEGIGVSPDGKWVYAANRGEQTVSVVDTAKMETVKTLPSPGLPYRVEFTPNGKYALVANPVAASLDVFDVEKHELVKRIDATKSSVTFDAQGGGPAIGGIATHPGNRYVFCTLINAQAVALIDLVKGEVIGKYEASVSPDGVAFSPIETKD